VIKKQKKRKMNKRAITQIKAYFLIVNLILALVAFSWLVSGQKDPKLTSLEMYEEQNRKPPSDSLTPPENRGGADTTITKSSYLNRQTVQTPDGRVLFEEIYERGELTYKIDGKIAEGERLSTFLAENEKVDISKSARFALEDAAKNSGIIIGEAKPGEPVKGGTGTVVSKTTNKEGITTLGVEDAAGNIKTYEGKKGLTLSRVAKTQAGEGIGWTEAVTGYFGGNLVDNLISAGTIGGIGLVIGSFVGGNGDLAGFLAGFGGTIAAQIAEQAVGPGNKVLGLDTGLFGVVVAAIIFVLVFEDTKQEVVEFNCLPYEAPVGGRDCELCNEFEECSEYRCKSLGQACELIKENIGTDQEACVWVNPHDVSSPMIKMESVLENYIYRPDTTIRPPATGVVISKSNGDCVEAFTPLEFTFITNEPAQCKIDYELTESIPNEEIRAYDLMSYYVGGTNMFTYNHTETMSLPGPNAINSALNNSPELINDGAYTLYVRCQDANGNFNDDAFSVRFCVDPGPDTTPPRIVNLSIPSNSPVNFNKSKLDLEVYINEPATCKWAREDKDYELMETEMSCETSLWDMNNENVYTCKTTLTGIENRKENDYYFRCKDQPNAREENKNVNVQSSLYKVLGTQPLNILEVNPEEGDLIKGSTETIPVFLEVKTDNGFDNGKAYCYYTTIEDNGKGDENEYIEFSETGEINEHSQRQDLGSGTYTYYIKCLDLGGNAVYNSTTFDVESDKTAPSIVRVYKTGGQLQIITIEDSECSYSTKDCNFEIDDGIKMSSIDNEKHTAEWTIAQTYYIRCKDDYNNQPNPNTCSLIAKPFEIIDMSNVIVL
jgi:hypothetical protein